MASRYNTRKILINKNETYHDYLQERDLNFVKYYNTAIEKNPTPMQVSKLTIISHIWTVGDMYYKLAHKYYGRPQMWWIIAWFNKKASEAMLKFGDVIYIPLPLEQALVYHG